MAAKCNIENLTLLQMLDKISVKRFLEARIQEVKRNPEFRKIVKKSLQETYHYMSTRMSDQIAGAEKRWLKKREGTGEMVARLMKSLSEQTLN